MSERDVFGEPDANDATAEWDRTVEEAAREQAEMFKLAKTNVLNRQLGSKKVSGQDQLREYEMMREEPAHLAQFLKDQGSTLEESINWAFDMENKLRRA